MGETETVTAGDLKPGVFAFDGTGWVEIVNVERRFDVVKLTIEDSAGRESTWPLSVDWRIVVETSMA